MVFSLVDRWFSQLVDRWMMLLSQHSNITNDTVTDWRFFKWTVFVYHVQGRLDVDTKASANTSPMTFFMGKCQPRLWCWWSWGERKSPVQWLSGKRSETSAKLQSVHSYHIRYSKICQLSCFLLLSYLSVPLSSRSFTLSYTNPTILFNVYATTLDLHGPSRKLGNSNVLPPK